MVFRKPLQPAPRGAFTTEAARHAGVTPRQLRNPELSAPIHGVRVAAAGFDGSQATELARAYLPKLPQGSVFSHQTAAAIWGIPLPDGTLPHPIHVTTPPPGRARRGRGIIGHRITLADAETTTRRGLPVTTPVRTWCDLGALLSVPDLVAAGDRLLWFQDPLCVAEELERGVGSTRTGVRVLRAVLPMLSDRSQSQRESMLRVLIVQSQLGLPRPAANHELTLHPSGRRVRLDLAFPAQRLGLEYEGDHHRTDRAQWRADIRRIDDLEAAGWHIMRITDDDIRGAAALQGRIAARLRTRGWVPSGQFAPNCRPIETRTTNWGE